ncbi:hypothetical protein FHT44_005063 [Mycolicibacterium sp. BK634]|nr:hypothetical protein [Mycolicibacterium sp. BK634]
MHCIECYTTNGEMTAARFTINGQSVCEEHVNSMVISSGLGLSYAWVNGSCDPRPIQTGTSQRIVND